MAIDKNFVIKNGLEVNTNVLVAAADEKQVGIGTTRPYYKLHVGGGEGSRGGIGATDLTISGIATIGVAHSDSGAFRVLGISTFQGDVDLLGSAGVSTVRWDASENRLEFKDNASIGFGTGNDLTLWHDSSTSYIKDTVGDLRIAGDKITLELEDGTDVKVIDQFGVNITGVTTTNRLYVSGIATVGTALSLADNIKAQFGTGGDLRLYHDGTNGRIDNATGEIKFKSAQYSFENAAGNENLAAFSENGAARLYYDNTERLSTTAIGATVFGDLVVAGVTTAEALKVTGISTFVDDVDFDSKIRFDESESALTFTDGTAIRVGTGSDFSIIHDGSNTILKDNGTGAIHIRGDVIAIQNAGGTETQALFTEDDSVDLYFNGTERLSTTAIGATVFGDFIASGVGTFGKAYVTGISTFANTLNVSTGATITTAGNAAFAGIVTANGGVNVGTAVTIDAGTGNVAVSGIMTVGGNLYVTGDITYDEVTGRNLNISGFTTFADDVLFNGTDDIKWDKSASAFIFNDDAKAIFGDSTDLSIYHNGTNSLIVNTTGELKFKSAQYAFENAAGNENLITATENGAVLSYFDNTERLRTAAGGVVVTGIATADRFIGIHTSTDGGGVGIGSTTAHVGYGITYIDFKGPGVSTVYYSSVTGVSTVYFQGGGSSVGAAGTWQNDGTQGISTAKSVGINTVGVAVTALMGGEKGASSGIGASMQGLYIGNGMMINDNQLNGNHYIGTAFGGIMAGPVTVNGVVTVDGNWAVV